MSPAPAPQPPTESLPLGARIANGLLRITPISLILAFSSAIGRIWHLLSAARRQVARENLELALGDELDSASRSATAREAFRSLTRVFGELAVARRLYRKPDHGEERLRLLGDWDELREEAGSGQGGLIVTAHLGNWELGAFAVRQQEIPLRVMARPTARPGMEALLTRWRGGPDTVLPKVGGLKTLIRHVRAGEWIALLSDQNAGRHGIFVPFFGLEASTFPTPATLATRLDVPIYLGACLRRPGPAGSFDVHLKRLETGGGDAAELMARINGQMEAWIRLAPDQYNWPHRRWKTRPPGRDHSEPGQPSYARLWPTGADGRPIFGREPMPLAPASPAGTSPPAHGAT